jgi:glyoxylase-like metal-dependent hydrolase (beta-lactamase superfamily II)
VALARGLPVLAAPATLDALRARERMGLYRHIIWGAMHPLDGTIQPLDAPELALIPTPGHSDDHHVVWDAERAALFAGDLFLGVKVRVARPFERPRALVRSLRAAAALRPRTMFDAHRGSVPDPAAALTAKADWLEETIGAVERLLAAGVAEKAIVREVLGREDGAYYITAGDLSRVNFVRRVRDEPRSE